VKFLFFTIGHSNRRLEEFVELLTRADIGLVADVRNISMSGANLQFNQDTLLDELGIFNWLFVLNSNNYAVIA